MVKEDESIVQGHFITKLQALGNEDEASHILFTKRNTARTILSHYL